MHPDLFSLITSPTVSWNYHILISARSGWFFRLGLSPVRGRVLQSPLHRHLIEGDRLSILHLDGRRQEGESVGVGRSSRQRDQGRGWPLLQLGFIQAEREKMRVSYGCWWDLNVGEMLTEIVLEAKISNNFLSSYQWIYVESLQVKRHWRAERNWG